MNRFDYIIEDLEHIIKDEEESSQRYTLSFIDCVDYYKFEDGIIPVDLDESDIESPFISRNIHPSGYFEPNAEIDLNADSIRGFIDGDWSAFHFESSYYEEQFYSGDENAIFEFCKYFVWAFRTRWVVVQIEQWRDENTPESREKLWKLMRRYTIDTRGKTPINRSKADLQRDKKIYTQVAAIKKEYPNKSIEQCIHDVTESRIRKSKKEVDEIRLAKEEESKQHTVKEIYWKFRKIEKLMGELLRKHRGKVIGFRSGMRSISLLLRVVFQLDKIIESLAEELQLYKEMRYSYEKVVYESDDRFYINISRKKGIKIGKTGKDLESIFKQVADSKKEQWDYKIKTLGLTIDALEYVRNIYYDYRFWEAASNDENFDEVKAKEKL